MADIQARMTKLAREVAVLERNLEKLEARIQRLVLAASHNPEVVGDRCGATSDEMERLRQKSVDYRAKLDQLRGEFASIRQSSMNLDGLPPAIAKYLTEKLDKKQ